jgi:rhamnulokinase
VTEAVAAVDLGATSGRVMLGYVGHNELSVRPVARFPNLPVRIADGLHWDILDLYRHVTNGLAAATREEPELTSVGVDSWAVDYALLRGTRMLGTPFHYRDERTTSAVEVTHSRVSPSSLYAANGLQFLPFNTLYQLEAERSSGLLDFADSMLLVPDLIAFWLTGRQVAERTNASTTGLLDISSGEWDDALIARLELPRGLFRKLISPGETIGQLRPDLGISGRHDVVAVGSHDTASAVVAVPSTSPDFAYISCGTWGLVGVETEHPVLSETGRLANFTNEGGVDGRVRYLHNVMGLWLLSESVRAWEKEGRKGADSIDLPSLLDAAAAVTGEAIVFDANDPRFLSPGDMPARIAEWLGERGLAVPRSRAEFVLSIIRSLATAFADAVRAASELSGVRVDVIHIVGGGSQNELLCQLTADLSGVPVLAGPVEATAIGNVLVQARANGFVTGSLEALRGLVVGAFSLRRYVPQR